MNPEYTIIGSGLTGAVIARVLTDAGKSVRIIERRDHVGGNVHVHVHASGIRIHTYGPHYFRTNDPAIWEFVNRFATFYRYEACILSLVDGALERWPISADYIRRTVGDDWRPAFVGTPSNFEEASLAMMPEAIYTKFVKGYSEKQWEVPASELSATLARRFDVREGDDARLLRHEHQGIPEKGYAFLMAEMLKGIEVETGCDFLDNRARFEGVRNLVFTGPIDAFFGFDLVQASLPKLHLNHSYWPMTLLTMAAADHPAMVFNECRIEAGLEITWKDEANEIANFHMPQAIFESPIFTSEEKRAALWQHYTDQPWYLDRLVFARPTLLIRIFLHCPRLCSLAFFGRVIKKIWRRIFK